MVTEARERPIARHRNRPSVVSLIGLTLVGLVVIWLAINFYKAPADFVNITLFGVTTGLIYALIALGYTLVYGILELINFAHGHVFMLGGMMSATVAVKAFGLGGGEVWYVLWPLVLLTLAVSMVGCGLINVTVEWIAYRPLR